MKFKDIKVGKIYSMEDKKSGRIDLIEVTKKSDTQISFNTLNTTSGHPFNWALKGSYYIKKLKEVKK